MSNQRRGTIAMVAGLALVILSFAWSYIVPTEVYWDEQDQQVYSDAAERHHQAGHRLERAEAGRSESEKAAAQAELQAATEQFGAEQKRFEGAESRMVWVPRVFLVAGIALVLLGVAWLAR